MEQQGSCRGCPGTGPARPDWGRELGQFPRGGTSWQRAKLASSVLRLPLSRTEAWSRSDSCLPSPCLALGLARGLLGHLASRWPCKEWHPFQALLSSTVAAGHMWSWALEMWPVWAEIRRKCEINTDVQEFSTKNNVNYLINFLYWLYVKMIKYFGYNWNIYILLFYIYNMKYIEYIFYYNISIIYIILIYHIFQYINIIYFHIKYNIIYLYNILCN